MPKEPDFGDRKPCDECKAVKPLCWYRYNGYDNACTTCRDLEAQGALLPQVAPSELRLCTQCILRLPKREFGADKKGKEGLNAVCKTCRQLETAKARLARRYRKYVLESRKRNNQVGE